MKKIFIILAICLTTLSLQAKGKFKEGELPKDMIVLSQSGNGAGTTVIGAVDLKNNEYVIIRLDQNASGTYWCYRTGITIDMSKQKAIEGTSSSDDE